MAHHGHNGQADQGAEGTAGSLPPAGMWEPISEMCVRRTSLRRLAGMTAWPLARHHGGPAHLHSDIGHHVSVLLLIKAPLQLRQPGLSLRGPFPRRRRGERQASARRHLVQPGSAVVLRPAAPAPKATGLPCWVGDCRWATQLCTGMAARRRVGIMNARCWSAAVWDSGMPSTT